MLPFLYEQHVALQKMYVVQKYGCCLIDIEWKMKVPYKRFI